MIKSEYDAQQGVMMHVAEQEIGIPGILSATAQWFTHAEFDPQAPVIWNLGTARMTMSIEEMRVVYGAVRSAVDTKRTGGKTAWVHQSELVRAVIKLVHGEFDWGSEWQTFETVAQAQQWCGQR